MFNKKDNLSQLKKLSSIKADSSWVTHTKYELLSEIDVQNRMAKAQQLNQSEKMDMFVSRLLSKVVPTFNRAIAGFLIIIMGSGVGFAAQASVPGQALWPIKRTIEKAELTLTWNSVKEAEIHMKHINKRLNEIEKILEDKNTEPEKVAKKEKAIKQAVSHLEKDVKSVDTTLKIVKSEKEAVETVALAKKAKDAVKETSDNLKKQAVGAGDKVIEDAIDDLNKVNQDVEFSLVNLALEIHEELVASEKNNNILSSTNLSSNNIEGDVIDSTDVAPLPKSPEVTSDDSSEVKNKSTEEVRVIVKDIISSEIDSLSGDIAEVKNKISVAENATNTAATDNLLDTQEAEDTLNEAKTLLEEGALKDAVEKISETKEIQKKSIEALEKIEEEQENTESNEEVGESTIPDETENTVQASMVEDKARLEEE